MLSIRTAQTQLENLLHDTILYALGNRLQAVGSVAALRAVGTQGASGPVRSDDDLIAVVSGGMTTSYRWSTASTAADNGASVIKPTDVTSGPGRWLSWTSPVRFAPVAGGDSATLDQITSGIVQRVLVLDKSMAAEDVEVLLSGAVPAVVIEASSDEPADATLNVGHLWLTDYQFTIGILTRDYRDGREHAQAPEDDDFDPGANSIDGAIQELLAGTQLAKVESAIRHARLGGGRNYFSAFGQRRVMRTRDLTIRATTSHAQAPNETVAAELATLQANLTELNAAQAFDPDNYVQSGITVAAGAGLVRMVAAGAAVVGGTTVTYAGELQTFAADSDTYRDLADDGSMTFVVAAAGVDAPEVTPETLRIGVTRTDGSGILYDLMLAAVSTEYGPVQQLDLT